MVTLSDQFGKPYFTKGGQGKFFPDQKPIDEHRYQRGFTPQRMSQVKSALSLEPGQQLAKFAGHYIEGTKFVATAPKMAAHFQEAVARSTVPTRVLRDQVSMVHVAQRAHPDEPLMGGLTRTDIVPNGLTVQTGQSSVNIYHGSRFGERVPPAHKGGPQPSRNEIMGAVTIHELGHAHQAMTKPLDFPHKQSGSREHYADRFAEKHFQSDPRDVRRGTDLNPQDISYPATTHPVMPKKAYYRNWDRLQVDALSRQFRMHGNTMHGNTGRGLGIIFGKKPKPQQGELF